ncbi:exported hypothetical protein [Nitrolancea hollandica Lb]|uniref:Uncharacterized protein n=1 Tax=Nitrolancea hollandica Lb TaxID=1129897 RepID=I4EFX2_9BACT|nr:exported hypothetical protein [Nitrolancea hollandica Lb]
MPRRVRLVCPSSAGFLPRQRLAGEQPLNRLAWNHDLAANPDNRDAREPPRRSDFTICPVATTSEQLRRLWHGHDARALTIIDRLVDDLLWHENSFPEKQKTPWRPLLTDHGALPTQY